MLRISRLSNTVGVCASTRDIRSDHLCSPSSSIGKARHKARLKALVMLSRTLWRRALHLSFGILSLYAPNVSAHTAMASVCKLNNGLYSTIADAAAATSVVPVDGPGDISATASTSSSFLSLQVVGPKSSATAYPHYFNTTAANATAVNATTSAVASIMPSSNCSSYLEAVITYCTHLASGYGTTLSPKLGLFNSSLDISDPLLYPFIFNMTYMPSPECSNTISQYSNSSDFALAFAFQGKTGLNSCFDMYSFSECSTSSCMWKEYHTETMLTT